jgi:alkyl hydroperoxide reductase subunit AhpF
MSLLDDGTRKEVKKALGDLPNSVRLVTFTQEFECQFCRETRQLIEEVASLDAQINVIGEKDYGIRFYGIPSGYEFSSLIESIKLASTGEPQLSPATLEYVQGISEPVHIQVYVTPTCPYCPQAVVLGFNLAVASEMVRSDMVEATEFPHLANKYQVMGVPRSVINEDSHLEGAAPEAMVLEKIREALSAGVED